MLKFRVYDLNKFKQKTLNEEKVFLKLRASYISTSFWHRIFARYVNIIMKVSIRLRGRKIGL